jgi:GNAT superfamily N-acetyltransferase
MTLRPATVDDVERLVAMGRRFLATVYGGRLRDNPARLAATATQLATAPGCLMLVALEGDAIVGMIGATVFEHPMSGERTATEVCWWMEPEHRGAGVRLLRRFFTWAKAEGATVVQMIAPTPDVGQLYERLGFAAIETTYQRRIA